MPASDSTVNCAQLGIILLSVLFVTACASKEAQNTSRETMESIRRRTAPQIAYDASVPTVVQSDVLFPCKPLPYRLITTDFRRRETGRIALLSSHELQIFRDAERPLIVDRVCPHDGWVVNAHIITNPQSLGGIADALADFDPRQSVLGLWIVFQDTNVMCVFSEDTKSAIRIVRSEPEGGRVRSAIVYSESRKSE